MQRYRSGYNGPDSKSGVHASVPWVRIPPAAPTKNTLLSAKSVFFVYPSRRFGISSRVSVYIVKSGLRHSIVFCHKTAPFRNILFCFGKQIKAKPCISSTRRVVYHQFRKELYLIKPQKKYTPYGVMRYKGGKPPLMIYTLTRDDMPSLRLG